MKIQLAIPLNVFRVAGFIAIVLFLLSVIGGWWS